MYSYEKQSLNEKTYHCFQACGILFSILDKLRISMIKPIGDLNTKSPFHDNSSLLNILSLRIGYFKTINGNIFTTIPSLFQNLNIFRNFISHHPSYIEDGLLINIRKDLLYLEFLPSPFGEEFKQLRSYINIPINNIPCNLDTSPTTIRTTIRKIRTLHVDILRILGNVKIIYDDNIIRNAQFIRYNGNNARFYYHKEQCIQNRKSSSIIELEAPIWFWNSYLSSQDLSKHINLPQESFIVDISQQKLENKIKTDIKSMIGFRILYLLHLLCEYLRSCLRQNCSRLNMDDDYEFLCNLDEYEHIFTNIYYKKFSIASIYFKALIYLRNLIVHQVELITDLKSIWKLLCLNTITGDIGIIFKNIANEVNMLILDELDNSYYDKTNIFSTVGDTKLYDLMLFPYAKQIKILSGKWKENYAIFIAYGRKGGFHVKMLNHDMNIHIDDEVKIEIIIFDYILKYLVSHSEYTKIKNTGNLEKRIRYTIHV